MACGIYQLLVVQHSWFSGKKGLIRSRRSENYVDKIFCVSSNEIFINAKRSEERSFHLFNILSTSWINSIQMWKLPWIGRKDSINLLFLSQSVSGCVFCVQQVLCATEVSRSNEDIWFVVKTYWGKLPCHGKHAPGLQTRSDVRRDEER